MKTLIQEIKEKREAIANNIVKGFSNSDDLFEKAHNHGDVHSNGKWYWESSANGGKGDWRTIKKNNSKITSDKSEPKDDTKEIVINFNNTTVSEIIKECKTKIPYRHSIRYGNMPGVLEVHVFNDSKYVSIFDIDRKNKKIILYGDMTDSEVQGKEVLKILLKSTKFKLKKV